LIYQHFSSFAEPQSMYQEYKLQPLRLRLKIMLDTSKILLLKSKFNSSIRKIEITYYNASVRAFTSNIYTICQNKESDTIEDLKSN
jgi:hypothetical protein